MDNDVAQGETPVHGTRLLSALILLPLFILLVLYGGEAGFTLLAMVVAAIGLWEFTRLTDQSTGASRLFAVAGGVGLIAATAWGGAAWFGLGVLLLMLVELGRLVVGGGAMEANLRRAAVAFLGVVYVAGPLAVAVLLRGMPGGERYVLLVCGIVWVGDTAAFYVGSSLGRHPLAPRVSPRKSVEGGVAGLTGSIVAAAALARALGVPAAFGPSLGVGAVVGTAGQMGDLVESLMKRAFQVKDTGRLIPGHGGMLDRIDSLLFAIPVFYLWVRLGWI